MKVLSSQLFIQICSYSNTVILIHNNFDYSITFILIRYILTPPLHYYIITLLRFLTLILHASRERIKKNKIKDYI
ncbi:hypothetical protein RCL_jg26668.t1 [Rhizophagus clarus]|uniref:Uncharacterized protein n=1 Tax=Rhizophagus clarus TaxID=94130 RepID=A0A8H3R038_9GLOM|nr:hypothetical protein RCL_jg26668.t1 [Rhizophagus clarus]